MKLLLTGIKNGKSCVVEAKDCDPTIAAVFIPLLQLDFDHLPSRQPGEAEVMKLAFPERTLNWWRIRFGPNATVAMHQTDTVDCHTIVSGSVDLLLSDGPHRLSAGDSAIVTGVDHGWKAGPEGYSTSVIMIATPKNRGE